MAFDLAISNLGDLVFAGNRDLAVAQQADLMRQRILIRIKLPRGSFVFGSKTLGSEITGLLRSGNTAEQRARATAIITQALKPMDDLSVSSISVEPNPRDVRAVIVFIEGTVLFSRPGSRQQTFQAEIPVPLALGPSEAVRNP